MRLVVIGGGIFGSTAALKLAGRGHRVTLVEPGPLPHPDAASTDISKIVRLDYGADAFYTELMERALPLWRELNARTPRPLFHETGFLLLSSVPLEPGSYEAESLAVMNARGHAVERLQGGAIARRFPALGERFVDGYHNPQGGWAESGAVVAWYAEAAQATGAEVVRARVADVDRGVTLEGGARIEADKVVVCAGAWSVLLAPELAPAIAIVGQPVLHFTPPAPDPFAALVPWAADIARTGWYGFPTAAGVVKVANHGSGVPIDPRAPRAVDPAEEPRFRAFLSGALPALADAQIVTSRLCLYTDSCDGDFWIARPPERPDVVIATGGSGHAFKFAPILGEIIADVVEEKEGDPIRRRFGWREPRARAEAARAVTRTS
jgi:glycine/D-amino acid oxidase-like deaminating enzyme